MVNIGKISSKVILHFNKVQIASQYWHLTFKTTFI